MARDKLAAARVHRARMQTQFSRIVLSAGWTTLRLAVALGRSHQLVAAWRRGTRKPGAEDRIRCEQLLGLAAGALASDAVFASATTAS